MRVSVVIATCNRADSLRLTLGALRRQTHRDFEVVVVQGPCSDDTPQLLADRADEVRVVPNPEFNLCKSRNLGIDAAAGEVVAFIDDDGIPEPEWLERLVAGYDDPGIGGVGGIVYDEAGVSVQYRWSVCDRTGETWFDREPPLDDYLAPGADPFLYLQGTNMSFRREALEDVLGFDENIEYMWDEADLALHLLDAGWKLRQIDGAGVVHRLLPSHLRDSEGTDPFTPVKNRTYFALQNAPPERPRDETLEALDRYAGRMHAWAEAGGDDGTLPASEARRFIERLEAGFDAGVAQGIAGERAGRPLARRDPEAFLPYPTVAADDRLRVCFVSVDYPPGPIGGIARYTADLARGFAAEGHEVHVVTRAGAAPRLDFEDGVWVHRQPEPDRYLPTLQGHPLEGNLAHCAGVWRAVDEVWRRFGLDLVTGNVWIGETLLCALDPRWPTVMTCSTPTRTIAATQPALAAREHTPWQVRLEDEALARADHLHVISQANLDHIREEATGSNGVEATVALLGLSDRAPGAPEPPADREQVEILFVGRLEPRKGVDTLLEAAGELLHVRPNVRLRMVGAQNPHANPDGHRYGAGSHDRIAFEGEVDDRELDRLLAGCDIFCAPSVYESFGLMNLEAMMFARPVVSCRAGGIPEVVADGETGLLVEPSDAPALGEALRRLVDDPELRRRMGAAGRARYETHFALDVAVERLERLFREVAVAHAEAEGSGEEPADVVRSRLREVLQTLEVAELEGAVSELLDPSAYPRDYRAVLARLEGTSDAEFVRGLYRAFLKREADPAGLEDHVGALAAGSTRTEVVERLARSDEARSRRLDTRFLGRLATERSTPGPLATPGGAPGARRRLAGLPGLRQARRAGRRVLRDPRVPRLERNLELLRGELAGLQAELAALREIGRRTEAAQRAQRIAVEEAAQHARRGQRVVVEEMTQRLSQAEARLEAALSRPEGTFGTYLGEGRVLVKTIWGGRLVAPSADLSLTPELVAHGVYEQPFTNYVGRTLERGDTAIDVGANIGAHTLLMASCVHEEGRVIAYEPAPHVLAFLRENVALNWIGDRVDVRAAAASDAAGRVSLQVTERFMGNSSLVALWESGSAETPMDTSQAIEVDAEPLDALAADLGEVSLVKIDVEGAEHLVLHGMAGLLDSGAVGAVSFEVYRERAGDNWAPLVKSLEAREGEGWRFHTIAEDGALEPIALAEVLRVGRFSQVVMTRPHA